MVQAQQQQRAAKKSLKQFQRRYDRLYGAALLGEQGLYELSQQSYEVGYKTPKNIRVLEIAVEFMKNGRFDRIERKLYHMSTDIDPNKVVVIHCEQQCLDRVGNLRGRQLEQWLVIRQAAELLGLEHKDYNSYGHKWNLDNYRNANNVFLQWVYTTSTRCDKIEFKKSNTQSHRPNLVFAFVA